jgi:hypothetical protein
MGYTPHFPRGYVPQGQLEFDRLARVPIPSYTGPKHNNLLQFIASRPFLSYWRRPNGDVCKLNTPGKNNFHEKTSRPTIRPKNLYKVAG